MLGRLSSRRPANWMEGARPSTGAPRRLQEKFPAVAVDADAIFIQAGKL
jgi:hypothetical protein